MFTKRALARLRFLPASPFVFSAFLFAVLAPSAAARDDSNLSGSVAPTPQAIPSNGDVSRQTERNNFGVDDGIDLWVPASEFQPLFDDKLTYDSVHYYVRTAGTGNGRFAAYIALPEGALINGYRPFYKDASGTANFSIEIQKVRDTSDTPSPSYTTVSSFTSTGSPGLANEFVSFADTVTLREEGVSAADFYTAVIIMPNDPNVTFKGVRFFWNRQMSAAPLTATFNDVPTSHPFFRAIEAFAASGITTGCGGGNFCPNGTVTRQEIAKFFARALGLHWSPF